MTAAVTALLNELRGAAELSLRVGQGTGRDPKDVALAYRFSQFGKSIAEKADHGDRRLGSGDAAAIVADLRALRDLGVIQL